jgi:hypothetical protein
LIVENIIDLKMGKSEKKDKKADKIVEKKVI